MNRCYRCILGLHADAIGGGGGVPKVAPDDKEEIELLRISLKGTFSVLGD